MSDFQSAIFSFRHRQHLLLEFSLKPGVEVTAATAALQGVGQQLPPELEWVLALGPALASAAGFSAFPGFVTLQEMPTTQRDAWLWVQAGDPALLFDAGQTLWAYLQDWFVLDQEVQGFFYHDMRDVTGFVDGIGNPQDEKALAAAIVPEGAEAGGSYVMTQLWQHDLKRFHQLPVPEQENVIGRTKADAVEFDEDRMPKNSHVGRTDVDHNGVPQKIWRRSVPWGRVQAHGLYFIAFSCELERFDFLLGRMVGEGDGIRDRLMDFSTPLTGSYWFAPAANWFL